MFRSLLALLVLLNLHAFGQEKPEQAAGKSAVDWLALVDAGQYGESWDSAAGDIQVRSDQRKVDRESHERSQSDWKAQSRKLKSARYAESLPNAPAGKYVVIQYDSEFDAGAAIETVTPMQEKDGAWKVSGYFVKPAQ